MEGRGGCRRREPLGGALSSHVGPRGHEERPPLRVQGEEPLPEERLPYSGETLATTTKRLREMSEIAEPPWEMSEIAEPPQEIADTDELPTVPVVPSKVPSREIRRNPSEIKLPPWLGKWGTGSEEKSPATLPALPPTPSTPAEKPSQAVPQRSRVTHDWQKEVVVDPLDSRPRKDLGSEDLQRGYDGLPIHQFLSSVTDSSPPKDCPPLRAVLLGQGQRKATLASMLYEKYSKETEEEIRPCPKRMESISTTHDDYRAMGFQSTPQPITQRHDYLTEQPSSFWMEQARGRPGVTALFGTNIPFKRNADFSTPITMYLGHPEPFNLYDPYDPPSRQLQPHNPQAQVCSSKRRQRDGQSMSSEERTAALTPKQTHGSPAFPAPPKPSTAALRPPSTGSPCPHSCPAPQTDPQDTIS